MNLLLPLERHCLREVVLEAPPICADALTEAEVTVRADRGKDVVAEAVSGPADKDVAGVGVSSFAVPDHLVEVGPGGRWVAEYYPHDSAEELSDGGLRITLRTPEPASLRRLALRLGRDGRIVSPPELADSARRAAAEARAAYDVPHGPAPEAAGARG